MEDIAEPELVQQIRDTIDKYEIDAVFDSGMAEHLMEKKWQEIFPIYQATTRPDKAPRLWWRAGLSLCLTIPLRS